MKNLILVLLLALFALKTFSNPIDSTYAKFIAENFYNSRLNSNVKQNCNYSISNTYNKQITYYIVCFNKGFVVISANDSYYPVLSYSTENEYTSKTNPAYEYWISQYNYIIDSLNNYKINDDVYSEERWLRRFFCFFYCSKVLDIILKKLPSQTKW